MDKPPTNYEEQFMLSKAEFEIERATAEMHRLNEENQSLDWEVPSEQERLLKNADKIDLLNERLEVLKGSLQRYAKFDPSAYAKAAVAQIFSELPPVSNIVVASKRKAARTDKTAFKPITRKHLTLIYSKG